jgi:hypothetical protein
MEAPRYSVTPPWSFAAPRPEGLFVTVSAPVHRAVSFSAALRQIVRWACRLPPRSSARDRQLEMVVVQKLVEEMGDEVEPTEKDAPVHVLPTALKAARPLERGMDT